MKCFLPSLQHHSIGMVPGGAGSAGDLRPPPASRNKLGRETQAGLKGAAPRSSLEKPWETQIGFTLKSNRD